MRATDGLRQTVKTAMAKSAATAAHKVLVMRVPNFLRNIYALKLRKAMRSKQLMSATKYDAFHLPERVLLRIRANRITWQN